MKKILLSAIICSATVLGMAQAPEVQWTKNYKDFSVEALTQSHDGGIVTVGANSEGNYTAKKFNLNGELQWEKTYDIADYYPFSGFIYRTGDGGYTFFAEDYNEEEGAEESDFYLVKINGNGEMLWANPLIENIGEIYSIYKTKDEGFLAVAEVGDTTTITKLNSDGTLAWSDILELDIYRALQTDDEGFLYAGYNNEGTPTIYKLDAARNLVWQKQYASPYQLEFIYGLEQTKDGGYVVLAELYEEAVNAHTWLVKLDTDGEILWEKTLLNESNDHVRTAANKDILVAGYNKISRFDSAGNLRWEQVYEINYITDLMLTNEGGFAFTSESMEDDGSRLVKLSTDNMSVKELNAVSISIYPNPATDILNFSQNLSEIKVYDPSGRLIKAFPGTTGKLNVNNLSKGNYILTGTTVQNQHVKFKLVKS